MVKFVETFKIESNVLLISKLANYGVSLLF